MFNNPYLQHPSFDEINSVLSAKGIKLIHLKGLTGSSKAAFFQAVVSKLKGNHLTLFHDKEDAAYFYTDITNLEGKHDRTLFFPSSYKRSVQYKQTDEANIITRTQTLKRLNEQRVSNYIITYAEALLERVLTRAELGRHTLEVKSGESLSTDFLEEVLHTYKFQQVDFVYEPGQFAIRGGIIDIFSFTASNPYRLDMFGSEVESIRTFDVESQRSAETLKRISIIPNVQWEQDLGEKRVSFLEYIPSNTTVWIDDLDLVLSQMEEIYDKTSFAQDENNGIGKEEMLTTAEDLEKRVRSFNIVEFSRPVLSSPDKILQFNTAPQPPLQKDFNLLSDILETNSREHGIQNFILSESTGQLERLRAIFSEINPEVEYTEAQMGLHEGFIDHDLKVAVFTDHQIFERYHKFRLHDRFTKKEALSVKELAGLNPGDYVVHVDHGIGKFGGLERLDVNGKKQEAVRLVYKDNDVLYVNIHSLHKISKYKGKEGAEPRIYKLGTNAWQKLKQKTKSKVKDIAEELIALYAKRREQKGVAFSPDTYLQRELEASFIYEDTPDQEKATTDFKTGMEADFPMDRLICGDVGFGKTEIAIRAAFKAVSDSKQVAVLVPTTILAFQHYNTFKNRLKNFPCNIDYISRFRSSAEQSAIFKKLKDGSLDIIIGTHKLVGQNVGFKDLGLLIIDEEQKFGVSVKEKLKKIKVNVDTLTLTATPIPRTLQFSLMGARDLSIINTPPPNRHPIITELHPFNEEIIREAIEYEVSRGGQVFFINNRVQNIGELKVLVDKLVPGIRSVIAHGQMDGKTLEKVMLEFMNGDHDVLIATSIIESGLDIPNTNTILINNAHHFGLSDLHQLRGRVGRSNRKAFCYLLAPHITLLTQEARRRLKAIEEHSGLGSGFNIAMQDLDIRGAGNLLGGEQSGFISDIGFETYHKILNEAITELREERFPELVQTDQNNQPAGKRLYTTDCHIDTDLELLLPESYVENITERMNLYRELDNLKSQDELDIYRNMLEDRFGPLPKEADDLLKVVTLRRTAMEVGVEKIILKNNILITFFVSNPDSLFYKSEDFQRIIANVQQHPNLFRMKQAKDKLSLRTGNVGTVDKAVEMIKMLEPG
ncbi:MAG TPA: transcription-repair coupling factor [Bacteroidales bacterium]|nr:transcription-repair coupling factor [Bacteroidales bacterium]